MLEALKKYAVFTGRSRRKEFWLFVLLYFIVIVVANMIDIAMFGSGAELQSAPDAAMQFDISVASISRMPFSIISYLALICPAIAVSIRRLHDTDRSGWWLLLSFVPLIGSIALFIFFCIDGTPGNNRFGPDPKAGERAAVPA